LLDRVGFSSGEIDGVAGQNLLHALNAFQRRAGLQETAAPDCGTWQALTMDAGSDVFTDFVVPQEMVDAAYLSAPLPKKLTDQAELPALSYGSLLESIAERFHASPRLLSRLNPRVPLTAGSTIKVPAVTPFDPAQRPEPAGTNAENVTVEVSKSQSTVRAVRPDGTVVFFAPVTSGSEHDPLPIGDWKVTGTSWMPPFHYNPDLFWDAAPTDGKAIIKPGPNNPVGVVWIDINVPHYGLHGTPEPQLVGHTQSHGCVRLTNWDAARLVPLVKPGTRIAFTE
jgi:lipoprotein-anchoring transpeptidase ErfK/SrfK